MWSLITTIDGGPIAWGVCQTACNAGAVACYGSAGYTFGTVTAGIGVPDAVAACNTILGTFGDSMTGFAFRSHSNTRCLLPVLLFLLFSPFAIVSACHLAGSDTGVCTASTDFDLLLPFCKSVVTYTACLPRYQSIWYNHSALTKDRFVEQMFTKIVIQRKKYETNSTFLDKNTDEWGGSKEIVPRFVDNPDCENAFKNYFCWLNFPRCDAEGKSLLLCRSVCENYMTSCQLGKDLWRCGEPKYVNGREPETSTTYINGQLVYYRAPFPGSPFKDYAVDPDTNKPLVVCTPSLENVAHHHSSFFLVSSSVVFTWLVFYFM